MSETYHLAIDPALGISEEQFIAAWNENPDALRNGRVAKNTTSRGTFDAGTAVLILQTAVGIASSVLTGLILDIIRHKYPLKKEPEIVVVPQEDGTKIIVVK